MGFAFGLVLVGAFVHAVWNLLAKRASGGSLFVWAYSCVTALLYFPLAVWALAAAGSKWSGFQALIIGVSGILHLGYSQALQAGYRRAGLSVVYPVARGTGPALSVLGAVVFLRETLSYTVEAGTGLVIAGVLVIGLIRRSTTRAAVGPGLYWGAITGAFIASYTLNDGAAVRLFGISPIVIDYFGNLVRLTMLAPVVIRRRFDLCTEWERSWKIVLAVGLLNPIPFILALYAMRFAPISLVAPARELSMLAGVLLGWKFLGERDVVPRLVGAALIGLGVAVLSLS